MPSVSGALAALDERLSAEGWRPAVSVVRSGRRAHVDPRGPPSAPSRRSSPARRAGLPARSRSVARRGSRTSSRSTWVEPRPTSRSASTERPSLREKRLSASSRYGLPASTSARSVPGAARSPTCPRRFGRSRVGPESAGAVPGPACYGGGGTEPTVTDANLLLGRLPETLLDGALPLDRSAAKQALGAVATEVELDLYAAAQGVVDIADESMAAALRVMSVERGLDPRHFALVAFGGAGPLHANALAALLGCYPVVVPPSPGVLSAYGFQTVGHRSTFTRTLICPAVAESLMAIRGALDEADRAGWSLARIGGRRGRGRLLVRSAVSSTGLRARDRVRALRARRRLAQADRRALQGGP